MKTINFNDIEIEAGTTLYYEDNNIVRQFDTFGIDNEEMALTGVRSEQTIYRILDANGIPRLKVRKPVRNITIGLDRETSDILDGEKPKNISEWVCTMIKRGYGKT